MGWDVGRTLTVAQWTAAKRKPGFLVAGLVGYLIMMKENEEREKGKRKRKEKEEETEEGERGRRKRKEKEERERGKR